MSEKKKENHRRYMREVWYPKNKKKHIALTRASKRKRLILIREKINKIKEEAGCADCGLKDFRVLEFDHVRGKKKFSISVGIVESQAWEKLLLEIEKCEVRCANCHRLRHIAGYPRDLPVS